MKEVFEVYIFDYSMVGSGSVTVSADVLTALRKLIPSNAQIAYTNGIRATIDNREILGHVINMIFESTGAKPVYRSTNPPTDFDMTNRYVIRTLRLFADSDSDECDFCCLHSGNHSNHSFREGVIHDWSCIVSEFASGIYSLKDHRPTIASVAEFLQPVFVDELKDELVAAGYGLEFDRIHAETPDPDGDPAIPLGIQYWRLLPQGAVTVDLPFVDSLSGVEVADRVACRGIFEDQGQPPVLRIRLAHEQRRCHVLQTVEQVYLSGPYLIISRAVRDLILKEIKPIPIENRSFQFVPTILCE